MTKSAPTLPRPPHGLPRAIIRSLAPGQTCLVRPEWIAAFFAAARRSRRPIVAVKRGRGRGTMYLVARMAEDWPRGAWLAAPAEKEAAA